VLAIAPAPPSLLFLPLVLSLERLRVVELRPPADLLIPAAQPLALLCPDARTGPICYPISKEHYTLGTGEHMQRIAWPEATEVVMTRPSLPVRCCICRPAPVE
jgi:hypothetical protein